MMVEFVSWTACCTSFSDHRKFKGQMMQPAAEIARNVSKTLYELVPASQTLPGPAMHASWRAPCTWHQAEQCRVLLKATRLTPNIHQLGTGGELKELLAVTTAHLRPTATWCPGLSSGHFMQTEELEEAILGYVIQGELIGVHTTACGRVPHLRTPHVCLQGQVSAALLPWQPLWHVPRPSCTERPPAESRARSNAPSCIGCSKHGCHSSYFTKRPQPAKTRQF